MPTSPLSTVSPSLSEAFKSTGSSSSLAAEQAVRVAFKGLDTEEIVHKLSPELAQQLEQLLKQEGASESLTRFEPEDLESSQLTGQITNPTSAQLRKINEMVGWTSSAEDWIIVPYQASNNLVDFDYRCWHRDAIVGMGLTYPGRPLIFDHAQYDSEKSAAFILESKLVTDESTDKKTLNGGGFGKYNREIIRDQGYIWLYLSAAVPVHSDTAEGILSRRYNDCSTGSILRGAILYCPNCSKDKGREVSFYEKDKNDEYVCPHLIPSNFMFWLVEAYGIEDADFADYAILTGNYHEAVELSNCNRGALPMASIWRS